MSFFDVFQPSVKETEFCFTPKDAPNGVAASWTTLALLGLTRIASVDPLGTSFLMDQTGTTSSSVSDPFMVFTQQSETSKECVSSEVAMEKGGCTKVFCLESHKRTNQPKEEKEKTQNGTSTNTQKDQSQASPTTTTTSSTYPTAFRFEATYPCSPSKTIEFYSSTSKQQLKEVNPSVIRCELIQLLSPEECQTMFVNMQTQHPLLMKRIASIERAQYMYIASEKPNSNYQDLDMVDFVVNYQLVDGSKLLVAVAAAHNQFEPSPTYRRSENEYRYVWSIPKQDPAAGSDVVLGISSYFDGMPENQHDTVASVFADMFNRHASFLFQKYRKPYMTQAMKVGAA